jgi:hypothetical protein
MSYRSFLKIAVTAKVQRQAEERQSGLFFVLQPARDAVTKPLRTAICKEGLLTVDLERQNLTSAEIDVHQAVIKDNGGQ